MEKMFFIAMIAACGYFYMHPEQFDALRGEAGVKAAQTVAEVQQQASESLIGVVQNTGDGINE